MGFITRNDPSLILVPDWQDFVRWVKEGGGHDEACLDINDYRCRVLQQEYLAEMTDTALPDPQPGQQRAPTAQMA